MQLKCIYQVDETIFRRAADLHYSTLSDRSFITLFGKNFLFRLYKAIVVDKLGFFIVATTENELIGFVLGCKDSSELLKIILKRLFSFLQLIVPCVLRNPTIIKRLLETLFYTQKEDINVKAELLIISIDDKFRSQGLGTLLVQRLNHEFLLQNINEYKVTVHKEMTGSNKFYLKNGMQVIKTFTLYNVLWNIYLNRIKPT